MDKQVNLTDKDVIATDTKSIIYFAVNSAYFYGKHIAQHSSFKEVEEKMNPSPLLEDVKKAIIDFRNREYGEENDFEMFDVLYPDLRHVGLAYTETPGGQHRIQYELDLEEKTWTQYVDDVAVVTESFAREGEEQIDPLRVMKDEIELSDFSDLVYIEEDQLQQAIRKAAQADAVYDSLDKDMDNDGVADRFDYAFQDSDALESTYDVDERIKEPESGHKPSILEQSRAFKAEEHKEPKESKTQEQER